MGRQRLSAPFCIFTLIGGDEKQSVMKAASLSNRRYLESRSLYVIPKQTDNFARPFRHWHEKEGPIEMTSYAEPSHRITGQSFTMLIKLHQTTQCKVFNTLINDWPPPSLYQLPVLSLVNVCKRWSALWHLFNILIHVSEYDILAM